MSSNIDEELQEFLNNIYYRQEKLPKLNNDTLQDVADEYNSMSTEYINQLSQIQNAEHLLYTTEILDNYQSKKPILDMSNITVQNREQQSAFAWGTLLKKAKEYIIQGRRDEAMKAKTSTIDSIANNVSLKKE